jgi:hypothetical protein
MSRLIPQCLADRPCVNRLVSPTSPPRGPSRSDSGRALETCPTAGHPVHVCCLNALRPGRNRLENRRDIGDVSREKPDEKHDNGNDDHKIEQGVSNKIASAYFQNAHNR